MRPAMTEKILTNSAPIRPDVCALHASSGYSLLKTAELAKILNVSTQWLEIGRCKGYGPPFRKLEARLVRYYWPEVSAWIEGQGLFNSTSEADQVKGNS